jgi:hypothetical protein
MNTKEILEKAKEVFEETKEGKNDHHTNYSLIFEFLRVYAGEESSFYKNCPGPTKYDYSQMFLGARICRQNLEAYIKYLEKGLQIGFSIQRKVQIETVSDYLSQAQMLLDDASVHAACPAMIIGASLEEFLRSWVDEAKANVVGKPSLDTYSSALLSSGHILKQDKKDIIAWAGIRNDAAHGDWEKVKEPEKIKLMLMGVNLFMQKYGRLS